MLAPTLHSSLETSRKLAWLLAAAGLAVCALPTLRGAPTSAEDDRPPSEPTERVRILEAGPLKDEPGAYRLRLAVHVSQGRRFRLSFRETPGRTYAPHDVVFEHEGKTPAALEVLFRYQRRPADQRVGNVLPSQQAEAEYRVNAAGCYPGGIATIVGVPLSDLPTSGKQLQTVLPEGRWQAIGPRGCRLMLICAKSAGGQKPESITPRGELVILPERTQLRKSADEVRPLEKLRALWMRQRTEVGTAHVKYRRFNGSRCRPLAPAQVNEILSAARLDQSPGNLPVVGPKLLRDQDVERWEGSWGEQEFRCAGLKTREDYRLQGRLLHGRVYDGELDLYYDAANRQIDVYGPSGSVRGRTTLSGFRLSFWLPSASGGAIDVLPLSDNRVLLKADRTEIVADRSTGFIRRQVYCDAEGEVTQESAQFHPLEYPGKIVFPTILARLEYRSGKLGRVEFVVVDSAEFNHGFAPDAFAMTVSQGTRIFDYRQDTFRPRFHALREDVADLAAYARRHWPVTRRAGNTAKSWGGTP